MKKLISLYIAIATLAFSMNSTALVTTNNNTRAAINETQTQPTFMFVINSEHTNVIKNKDGSHTLQMKKSDINHIIMFSDRPYRIVKYIKGPYLQELWTKGNNSFLNDPPNAVLTGNDLKPIIIQLNSFAYHNDTVLFNTHSTLPLPTSTINNASLIIDTCGIHLGPITLCLPG